MCKPKDKPKIVRRVDVLKEAKLVYISPSHFGKSGICACVLSVLDRLHLCTPIVKPQYIHELIPDFIPPKGKEYNEFWWNKTDTDSRLSYLNVLIRLYETDETNLYDLYNPKTTINYTI